MKEENHSEKRSFSELWKPLTFTTIIFLVIAIGVLLGNLVATGNIIERDIELKGGKLITVQVEGIELAEIENMFPEAKVTLVSGLQKTLLIETGTDVSDKEVIEKLRGIGVSGDYNVKSIGPVLGEIFWEQTQIAIIIAFVLMAIVIFIMFRTLVPSLAVILAATTDIVGTMAVMHILGMELSLASLAALMMLIGYSVDTDVLLTTEMLKDRGKVRTAAKTGLTMSATTLAVLFAMLFISNSFVINQIVSVLIIGLIIDIPATWLTNAGILRFYINRRGDDEL
jgi:preprotein translocase subunit SecF